MLSSSILFCRALDIRFSESLQTFPVASKAEQSIRCIDERTLVYFADNEPHVIEAYVENGEGIDRAGGFAIQVCGIREILLALCLRSSPRV